MKTVVIITHRYHYHICQIAALTAIKQFAPDKVCFLFDDMQGTQYGWNQMGKKLLNDFKQVCSLSPGATFAMPFSSVQNVQTEPSGWIRQQYVKMNLHKFMPGDEWLVIDGDVIVNQSVDPYNFWYFNPADPLQLHHDFFTRYVLDLKDKVAYFNSKPIEFSSIPLRVLTRKTLQGLEDYIFHLHKKSIREIRDSFTLQQNRSYYLELSEYSLISNYQKFITEDLLPIKELDVHVCKQDEILSNWNFLKDKIAVLDGFDNFPKEWYAQWGVNINEEIWQILYP